MCINTLTIDYSISIWYLSAAEYLDWFIQLTDLPLLPFQENVFLGRDFALPTLTHSSRRRGERPRESFRFETQDPFLGYAVGPQFILTNLFIQFVLQKFVILFCAKITDLIKIPECLLQTSFNVTVPLLKRLGHMTILHDFLDGFDADARSSLHNWLFTKVY